VAWISDRKDLLSALFLMVTLGALPAVCPASAASRYLLVLAGYTLCLMSKASLVTLPFLLSCSTSGPGTAGIGRDVPSTRAPRQSLRRLVWEKVPLCLLAGIFTVVAVVASRARCALLA